MRAVILASGYGIRISEETQARPKPTVEVGGRLVLWRGRLKRARDFVYADGVAEACTIPSDSHAGDVYDMGSGEDRTLRETASAMVAQLGRSRRLRFGERAPPAWDSLSLVADISRNRSLGLTPRTGFDEGTRHCIEARRAARSVLP